MATRDSVLHASPGDRLVIRGHHVGEVSRDAEIVDVLGENGRPPYLVRWEDDGRVSQLYPGSDAYIQHFEHRHARTAQAEPTSAGTSGHDPAEGIMPSTSDWEAALPPRDS